MSDELGSERELEDALAALAPAGPGLSREDVLFAAGRRFERRRARAWKAAGGVAVAVLAALAAWRPAATPVERVVYVEKPEMPSQPAVFVSAPPPPLDEPSLPPPGSGYFALRERVLLRGLDALPASPASRSAELPVEFRHLLSRTGGRL